MQSANLFLSSCGKPVGTKGFRHFHQRKIWYKCTMCLAVRDSRKRQACALTVVCRSSTQQRSRGLAAAEQQFTPRTCFDLITGRGDKNAYKILVRKREWVGSRR